MKEFSHIKYDGYLEVKGEILSLYYIYSTKENDYLITVDINGAPTLIKDSNGVGGTYYTINEDELSLSLSLTNEDGLLIPLHNLLSLDECVHIKSDSFQMLFEELFKLK